MCSVCANINSAAALESLGPCTRSDVSGTAAAAPLQLLRYRRGGSRRVDAVDQDTCYVVIIYRSARSTDE